LNDMDIPSKEEIPNWLYKMDISNVVTKNLEGIFQML